MSRAEERIMERQYNLGYQRGYEKAEKDVKDALLKWLEGKMTVEGAMEGIVGGYDLALKDVINKLNEL